jgi:hypothetical protein
MIDQAATRLLMTIVETPGGKITASVLDDFYPRQGKQLMQANLLAPLGDTFAAPLDLDHGDEPLPLIWSGEHGGFGYYNAAAVWITVPPERLTMFGVNMPVLLARMLAKMEIVGGAEPLALVPNAVWEIGNVRLSGRSKPVPLWVARRLSDPDCWSAFVAATRLRPAPGLRIVLSTTPAARLPKQMFDGHEIVSAGDVADRAAGIAVDPALLAARITNGSSQSDVPIAVSADGGSVTVRGKRYTFTGQKHRTIIRHLHEAWENGEPECLTEAVLEAAECANSVNTLTKAFSGRKDWQEFIKVEGGRCWIYC